MSRHRRWWSLGVSLAVLGAAVGVGSAGGERAGGPVPGAERAPLARLCGLAQPLDPLFGCIRTGAATPSTPTADATQSAASSGGSSTSLPPGAPPRASSTRARFVPNLIVVTLRQRASQRQAAALFAHVGVRQVRSIAEIQARVVSVAPSLRAAALRELRSSRLVEAAERDPIVETLDVEPNDAYWPDQWGLRAVGLPSAWLLARAARGVVVAVVDTGVAAGEPDLAGALLPGIDLVDSAGAAADEHGHGTAVAGVIAARTDNHTGEAGACGLCSILPIKALGADGRGDDATIARAVVRATDAGARVVNLSLGSPAGTQALADAVAYAQKQGVLVVAAAGNSGAPTPFFPAAYPGVVSVAGTDAARELYPWSNYGPAVALAAPGCNVAPLLNGAYGNFCGTSSAAPVVAGIAALALAADPTATGERLAAALTQGTIPLAGRVRYGLVQAPAALAGLGIRAPGPLASSVVTGVLSARVRSRTYARTVPAGRLAASLTFAGPARLTLSIADSSGKILVRRTASSPLRIELTLPAGSFRIGVGGPPRPVRFRLALATTAT